MRRRHSSGLTLVEVMVATVLLAIVAATCASLLRDASRLAESKPLLVAECDLARVVDRWMAPAQAGIPESPLRVWLASSFEETSLAWPRDPSRTINARRIPPAADRADHEWLEFECLGTVLWRWSDARVQEHRP